MWSASSTTLRRSCVFSASSRSSNLSLLALPPSSSVVSGFDADCHARSRASCRLSTLPMTLPYYPHDPQPSVEWYRYARHITHVTSIATWWPGKYAPTQISHFVSARRTPPALDLNLRRGKWLRSVDTFC